MSEISETEIKTMTKEQNYFRGYWDGKSDVLGEINKMKAEIEQSRQFYEVSMDYIDAAREQELSWVLELIDKYIG